MADDKSNGDDSAGTVSTFVSSLAFNIVVAAAIFIAFSILRSHFKRVYAPRTYAVEQHKRSPAIGRGLFAWIPAVLSVPDDQIIQRVGLDTYMFLRSMRAMFIMFTVLSLLSVVTILPANITGGNNIGGLDRLSMGNVEPQSGKLWIHIVFFMVFVAWVMANIFGELKVYTRLRMWWLTNPEHTRNIGASTVLVSSLPDNLVDQDDKLNSMFSMFPGGVRQIIVNRNVSELEDAVNERDARVKKLENLLTKYAVQCEKAYKNSVKKGTAYKEPKRPLMRESKVPFKGPKIDAITHHSTEIAKLNKKIAEFDGDLHKFKRQSSAFILFNKQIAAHMSAQTVLDYKPFSMNSVSLEVNPADIIWSNLNMNPYDRRMRSYISFGISVGLTIAWTLLTAFLTALVGVKNLSKIPGLENMSTSKWLGLFTGIVPTVLMAVLMFLLPIILRLLLKLEGTPSISEINLRLLHRYYFFQVWNVYLVTIFSSSILSIATGSIGNPGEIVYQIQANVPKSATTILTYVLLLAFTGAAKEILQAVSLALRYILPILFAKTPRAISDAEKPSEFDWGTNIPTHSLIFLMGFSYSFIAPIVNCFVAVYFGFFYLIYRYQFLYVYNDANWVTGGLSFPKFIKQMLVGVYISEVYMLLMMVAKFQKNANAILRIIFSAAILAATLAAHMYINDAYMPIINYLPTRKAAEVEEDPEQATRFPDIYDDSDLGSGSANADPSRGSERKMRQRIYAMYGSLIPIRLIDYVLQKIPSLLIPSRSQTSAGEPADEESNAVSNEEEAPPKTEAYAGDGYFGSANETGASAMPTAHHYDSVGVEIPTLAVQSEKRDSANTNIFSIDSNVLPRHSVGNSQLSPATAMFPDATERSIVSATSASNLRQRNARPVSVAESTWSKKRHSMNGDQLLATTDDDQLAEAFLNPALQAKAGCSLWVPMDNNRLCWDLYDEVHRNGEGTIQVITDGTWINEKCKVEADVDFDLEDLEEYNEEPKDTDLPKVASLS
ncbi:DUF221-domain-containing protein [Martensiomyces pterosporus]|nr:DUF221-domain-containing protein [Martensiomyces pterosporus]